MAFIAQDSVTGKYVTWRENEIKLVTLVSEAKKFKTKEHWTGFVNSQLRKYCQESNASIAQFKIISDKTTGTASALPEPQSLESKEVESYELKTDLQQEYAEGENMDTEKNTEHIPFSVEAESESIKSPFDGGLSMDELLYMLSTLPQLAGAASTLVDNFQAAMDLCQNELKRADAELLDIAHKIEFAVVNVVGGYRLYKEFHDCRLRRRKVKDTLELLQLIASSGILEGIRNFSNKYGAYKFKLENRTYHPRIRDDLFQDGKEKKEEEELE